MVDLWNIRNLSIIGRYLEQCFKAQLIHTYIGNFKNVANRHKPTRRWLQLIVYFVAVYILMYLVALCHMYMHMHCYCVDILYNYIYTCTHVKDSVSYCRVIVWVCVPFTQDGHYQNPLSDSDDFISHNTTTTELLKKGTRQQQLHHVIITAMNCKTLFYDHFFFLQALVASELADI